MPLSWDFSARWFACFGGADQRHPERTRNKSAGDAGMPLIAMTAWCSVPMVGDHLGVN